MIQEESKSFLWAHFSVLKSHLVISSERDEDATALHRERLELTASFSVKLLLHAVCPSEG